MKVYAEPPVPLAGLPTDNGWDVVKVQSESNPNRYYTVDITFGRCSCPAWKFQKGGRRKPCKHLLALGFKEVFDTNVDLKEPTKVSTVTHYEKVS